MKVVTAAEQESHNAGLEQEQCYGHAGVPTNQVTLAPANVEQGLGSKEEEEEGDSDSEEWEW